MAKLALAIEFVQPSQGQRSVSPLISSSMGTEPCSSPSVVHTESSMPSSQFWLTTKLRDPSVSACVSQAQHPSILIAALSTSQRGAGDLGTDTQAPGNQDQFIYTEYKVPRTTCIYQRPKTLSRTMNVQESASAPGSTRVLSLAVFPSLANI